MALPEVVARLEQEGAEPVIGSAVQTITFLAQERARWGQLVKTLDVRWE